MSNIIDSIQLSGVTYQIQGSGGGVPESTFTAYTATTDERISQDEEVTAAGLNALNDKITPTVELTQAQYDALVTAGTVSADTYYIITDATAFDPSTKVDTSAFTAYSAATNTALNGKVNTSSVVSSVTSASTDSEIPTAKAVWEAASGGGKAIEAGRGISITTGATADTVSFNLPISAGTGSNSIVEGGDTEASGNFSHAEGWYTIAMGDSSHAEGRTTSAMTNYSHAEGWYTIAMGDSSHAEGYSTAASVWGSHAEGDSTLASGYASHAEGSNTTANGHFSHAEGSNTIANNQAEHASGQYNVSNKANNTFGDSGNTLFSVGNGTSNNARHNAFEIRQNGDIYISSGGTDIKLQDNLGGGGSVTVDTALDSGSTNPVENRVIYNKFDEVEQVTARALNGLAEADEVAARALIDLNDKFGGLKLQQITQSDYNNLQTKDPSTLYIIVN